MKSTSQKKEYVGYSLKQRLLPVLLLAFSIPFTLIIAGPIDLFASNMAEFHFVLGDFIGISILLFLAIFAVIVLILLPISKRAFDITYAVFAAISFLIVIQGNYLNGNISLAGDGVGSVIKTSTYVINTIVWLVIIAGFVCGVIFFNKRDILRTIMIILSITIIGMQLITTIVSFLTNKDIFTPHNKKYENGEYAMLSDEYLTEFGTENNIIYFVVDRFDYRYFEKALKNCPEIFDSLDGFTYYSDNVAMYSRTFPSVPYMLTGRENDFTTSRKEYFDSSYSESKFLKDLKDKGYDIGLYTDDYYAYIDANAMAEYTSNLMVINGYKAPKGKLSAKMTGLSLYRYFPFVGKYAMRYFDSTTFNDGIKYFSDDELYNVDNKHVYNKLKDAEYSKNEEKSFKFIHISGCHMPNTYDENYEKIDEDREWDEIVCMKQSFQIISMYIEEMKKAGVYENATIIITGDHPSPIDDSMDIMDTNQVRITSLFVKRSGDNWKADIKGHTSDNPVHQGQIWAEIMDSEGIYQYNENETDRYKIPLRVKTTSPRTVYFERTFQGKFELIEYEIKGSAHNFANWRRVGSNVFNGSLYN